MRSDQELATGQSPVIDVDAPSSTYRISVDVDMVPAGMGSEQACGLIVAALESAYTLVRAVRVNQCSTLTRDGLHRQDCDGSVSKITS
jgi:phage terminase large subunit-like protein